MKKEHKHYSNVLFSINLWLRAVMISPNWPRLRRSAVLISFLVLFVLSVEFWQKHSDNQLHLIFCNVGQGDATLILFPNGQQALIDAGPNENVLRCLNRHLPFWDRDLDLVYLSHPHEDHYGGLSFVIDKYSVRYFISDGLDGEGEGWQRLKDKLIAKHITPLLSSSGERVKIGDITLATLGPTAEVIASLSIDRQVVGGSKVLSAKAADPNDFSLVLKLNYGAFSALFPGDRSSVLNTGPSKLTVLKVPHHGSKTAIELVKSAISNYNIISVSKNNVYKLPNAEILEILKNQGQVLRTDENGEIEITTNGQSVSVKTER